MWLRPQPPLPFLLLQLLFISPPPLLLLPFSSIFPATAALPATSVFHPWLRNLGEIQVMEEQLHTPGPAMAPQLQQHKQNPLHMFEVGATSKYAAGAEASPCASVHVLRHSFGNTFSPAMATYSPPPDSSSCGGCARHEWSRIVLNWRGSSAGRQFDRIAGVWFGGVELLRTSTAEPSRLHPIVWNVAKDVTKYSSLLSQPLLPVVVELGNVVDHTYTGVFHINISLDFFSRSSSSSADLAAVESTGNSSSYGAAAAGRIAATNRSISSSSSCGCAAQSAEDTAARSNYSSLSSNSPAAADLILPFSSPSPLPSGHWFYISNDTYTPRRSYSIPCCNELSRAVIEIYVSFHGSDEFWYTNPPNDFVKSNDLEGVAGNGAFREVQVYLDEVLVGAIWPYPVIYTGGIVNLYWRPAVGIGAFDLPTYEFDVSPFLGKLTDGKNHTIGVRVHNGLDHWLVDGSLQLWFDKTGSTAPAESSGSGSLLSYNSPSYDFTLISNFHGLNGSFQTIASRTLSYSGYVSTSIGNVSVSSSYSLRFENAMVFEENTSVQKVKQRIVSETEWIRSRTEGAPSPSAPTTGHGVVDLKFRLKQEFPLDLDCITLIDNASTTYSCSLSHALNANRSMASSSDGSVIAQQHWYLRNRQQADGYIVVSDNIVKTGLAELHQEYIMSRSSSDGDGGCYSRVVNTRNSSVLSDSISLACT